MKRRGLLIGALFALAACATTPATAPPPGEFSSDRISVVVQGGSGPDVIVRRACPVSLAYARLEEQSAYHMSRFHRAG